MEQVEQVLANPFWIWIAIGGIFLIIELLTNSGWLLWPAGAAAAVAVIVRFAHLNVLEQVVVFAIVTVAATYLGRRFMRPSPKTDVDINDLSPRLIGKEGEATSVFTGGRGRVFVDGKEWAAELDGDGDLAARAKVIVTEIVGGARLKVKPA